MTPQTLVVDETLSFAHRADEAVKVRLRLPDASVPAGRSAVGLSSGARSFKVAADVTADEQGVTVDFTARGARLRERVWSLALHPSSGGPVHVQARLLARPDQPVALLPGPVPTTRLPEPSPRTEPSSLALRAARRLPTPVKQVLRRGRAAAGRLRA